MCVLRGGGDFGKTRLGHENTVYSTNASLFVPINLFMQDKMYFVDELGNDLHVYFKQYEPRSDRSNLVKVLIV